MGSWERACTRWGKGRTENGDSWRTETPWLTASIGNWLGIRLWERECPLHREQAGGAIANVGTVLGALGVPEQGGSFRGKRETHWSRRQGFCGRIGSWGIGVRVTGSQALTGVFFAVIA